ncbi:MAG: hypothetical protein ACRC80_30605 [Waterburya sp.]
MSWADLAKEREELRKLEQSYPESKVLIEVIKSLKKELRELKRRVYYLDEF